MRNISDVKTENINFFSKQLLQTKPVFGLRHVQW